MKDYIENFPKQLEEALQRVSGIAVPERKNEINNIVVVGMGGSAFGAEVVKKVVELNSSVPMVIVRNYDLPAFVNENTLLIFSSYSGNTEETLSALHQAKERNIEFLAISSNGKVQAETPANCFFELPKCYPPRTAIAFSIITLLDILNKYSLIPDYKQDIVNTIKLLQQDFVEKALFLTEFIRYKFPVMYVPNIFESVGIRFQQQLNENSKILAHYGVVPEMNHNEIVGWLNANKFNREVRFILVESENLMHPRTKLRYEFMKNYLQENYSKQFTTITAEGDSLLEQIFYLIHLIDWTSLFLANKFNVDPISVEIIEKLKGYLKNL